jgi:radical SAM superfamily enzyme YgiQ (UPF0313 family)
VYREVFANMRNCDIFSVASFIVGLPGENPAARERHLEFALDAAPDSAQFLPFMPLPGTPFARMTGRTEADPENVRESQALSDAYRCHPQTISRLREAISNGGMRGVFAAALLKESSHHQIRNHKSE